MQSVDEDAIDEDSIIDDELLWANPGTTAEATDPAAIKAAIKASCLIMIGSGKGPSSSKALFGYLGLWFE